jgi:hypothetical protein
MMNKNGTDLTEARRQLVVMYRNLSYFEVFARKLDGDVQMDYVSRADAYDQMMTEIKRLCSISEYNMVQGI